MKLLALFLLALAARGTVPCSLHGRVKIVAAGATYRVRIVSAMADVRIKAVNSLPMSAGEWQIVDSSPDFTIQIVEQFQDFTVQFTSFPGCGK